LAGTKGSACVEINANNKTAEKYEQQRRGNCLKCDLIENWFNPVISIRKKLLRYNLNYAEVPRHGPVLKMRAGFDAIVLSKPAPWAVGRAARHDPDVFHQGT
jgi:hypothetical protein